MRAGSMFALALATLACASASAGPVVTTLRGHVTYVSPTIAAFGVQAGDNFTMAFEYDDAAWTPETRLVNGGMVYTVRKFDFTADLEGWTGSMIDMIRAKTSDLTSPVLLESWYRPETVLHHDEWFVPGWNLYMVTNYWISPGEPAYGWYGYEQADTVTYLLDSVETIARVSEPSSATLGLLALGLVGVATRSRARFRLCGVLERMLMSTGGLSHR